MPINRPEAISFLKKSDFKGLFRELLAWNRADDSRPLALGDQKFLFEAFAQQAGVTAYACRVPDVSALDYQTRQSIERAAATTFPSHLFVFFDEQWQVWQWSRRELGQPRQLRSVGPFRNSSSFEPILQKLDVLAYDIESGNVQATDVDQRLKEAFNVEPVTKKFYAEFQKQYEAFLLAITGVADGFEREFASLMLNRLMFLYFIQSKGFFPDVQADGLKKTDYLFGKFRDKATRVKGKSDYLHGFLVPLFFEVLSVKRDDRTSANIGIFGDLIYLNGGLFSQRDWEKSPKVAIPDAAFEKIFKFFGEWNWQLDERPTKAGNEINPDVLGYVFEKFINQKQMGAYYTKEDITGYISKNTILPFLFEKSGIDAERPLELLRGNIERYVYPAVKHGCSSALPADIEAGIGDVAKRDGWNKAASSDLGLPTEIWREVVARRERFASLAGPNATIRFSSVADLITHNLDISQWFTDLVADISEAGELEKLWTALEEVSVLDPTVGSGAFLFAAMGVLQPVYNACLERMEGFVKEADARASKQEFKAAHSFDFFRAILREIDDPALHPNRSYAIFKKLTVQNLFGVDIMPEASEICKLRLFLKLAAQVSPDASKPNLGIEPLPDIDFNIRSGNTLVGFASLSEVEVASQTQINFGVTWEEIRDEMRDYGEALDNFRTGQLSGATSNQSAKSALHAQHDRLVEKLNLFNAGLYGRMPKSQPKEYASWKASHQPFHWCAEFYSVIKNGGFDVIIGNPPYVGVAKIDYKIQLAEPSKFSDIYAHVVVRSLKIANQLSRVGMIVPLSLTFSEDFGELRKQLYGVGETWFSSYDNIPAALFAGVSQRCTIVLACKKLKASSQVAPMYRWRSTTREVLFSKLAYTRLQNARVQGDVPKLQSNELADILVKVEAAAKAKAQRFFAGDRSAPSQLKFSQAARNFVSVFVEAPPCLDEHTLKEAVSSEGGLMGVRSREVGLASMAMLSGELYFWFWLTRGDGFHVTSRNISDFLLMLNAIGNDDFKRLVETGQTLNARRLEALVFKKNAGKFVGNFNYRHLPEITRRADLLTLKALGASRDEALAVFDYVQRVPAINESAGEKSIPSTIKNRYKSKAVDVTAQRRAFDQIDRVLSEHYGFTAEELDFIINYDIKYRMGRDAGDD